MNNETNASNVLLEICTASVQDAITAQAGGAGRIELNTALSVGGLTPTPAMVHQALRHVSIPVIAMARPRESGFCYSELEFETLVQDVRWMLEAGVHGIAFGVLTESGQVDLDRCRQIVDLIGPERDAVFHRAFDIVADQTEAIETLVQCGVTRIMTSGGRQTAWQGRSSIARLVEQSADRIEILAAGSIRADHAVQLVQETAVQQIHAGLGRAEIDSSYGPAPQQRVSFFGKPPENPAQFRISCQKTIREMSDSLLTR